MNTAAKEHVVSRLTGEDLSAKAARILSSSYCAPKEMRCRQDKTAAASSLWFR